VYQFDGFFSAEEAEHIIALARPRLQASTGRAAHGTVNKVFEGRTSQTAGVEPWEDETVANLAVRVAGLVGLSVENLEVLSVTRYTGQQEYKPHRDSFGWRSRQDRFASSRAIRRWV
jgi:prolyl 4-hydroxylase